jgi:hypothetical protein
MCAAISRPAKNIGGKTLLLPLKNCTELKTNVLVSAIAVLLQKAIRTAFPQEIGGFNTGTIFASLLAQAVRAAS